MSPNERRKKVPPPLTAPKTATTKPRSAVPAPRKRAGRTKVRAVSRTAKVAAMKRQLVRLIQWVVFEPNDAALWARVVSTLQDHLLRAWRDGQLVGERPAHAYFVRCDRSTMSQVDIAEGWLVCLVGVAFLKPGEFEVIRIRLRTG